MRPRALSSVVTPDGRAGESFESGAFRVCVMGLVYLQASSALDLDWQRDMLLILRLRAAFLLAMLA